MQIILKLLKKFIFYILVISNFLIFENSSASPLVAGISKNEIEINNDFDGTQLIIFGAKTEPGDILIVIRGGEKNYWITKKEKFYGIWYNAERLRFDKVNSYYHIFHSSTLEANSRIFADYEIGGKNFILQNANEKDEESFFKLKKFQDEMHNIFEKKDLYKEELDKIEFLNETLFRLTINLPKDIHRGIYNVEIYLINNNKVSSMQIIPFYIKQSGLGATILNFAYKQSFLYAMIAVSIAIICGFLSNYIFSKLIGK